MSSTENINKSNLNDKKDKLDGEVHFTGKYSKTVLDTLWISYRPFMFPALLSIAVGFLGRLVLLANANIIGIWVDSLCIQSTVTENNICRPIPTIFQNFSSQNYIVLLLVMSIIGFFCVLLFRILFSRLSAIAISQIYDETTFRTSRQPMSFFDSTPAGRIITRFSSDYGNVFRLFGGPLAELCSIIFDLVSMLILITWASPMYFPIVILIGAVDFAIYKFNVKNLREARRQSSRSRSPSIAHFAETAQGASTIRTFIKQKSFISRFLNLDATYLGNKLSTYKAVLWFSFQINCMTAVFLFLTGAIAWFLMNKGLLSLGSIGVAFSFIALSGNTIQMFFEWISQLEEALVGVERLDQYLRSPLEIGAKLPTAAIFPTSHEKYLAKEEQQLIQETAARAQTPAGCASIHFENVNFRYGEDLPFVLKNLSFQIPAGERWGIVGRTGSGKSSLIQALFQLYPIHSGRISIDNVSAKEMDLEKYRRSISFIAQDPTLFAGSLRDNLDINHELDDVALFATLNKVGLGEWASADGLKKEIEEKGRNLSQGEKQLICMARCLLQNTPIVIMDEATASVDPQSEEILVKATEEFFHGKTQIIIAHRLSTLVHCDRILWLQNGEIIMIDTPANVLPIFQKQSPENSLKKGL